MNRRGVICNGCMKVNFIGRYYRCLSCRDFDLCYECYQLDVTTVEHLFDHPMKCVLTPTETEVYFGGEYLNGDPPQSYRCPYCKRWGFNESTFLEHITELHPNASPDLVSNMVTLFEQQQAARIFLEEEQLSAYVASANARNRMISRQIGLELSLEPLNSDGSYVRINRDRMMDTESGTNSDNSASIEELQRHNSQILHRGRQLTSTLRANIPRNSRSRRGGANGTGEVTVNNGNLTDNEARVNIAGGNISDSGRDSGQGRNTTRRQTGTRPRQHTRTPPLLLNLPTIPEFRRARLPSENRMPNPDRLRIAFESESRPRSFERHRAYDVERRLFVSERPVMDLPERRTNRLRQNELERRLTDRLRLSLSEVDNRRLNFYMPRPERPSNPIVPLQHSQQRDTSDAIGALMRFYGDSISQIFNESSARSASNLNYGSNLFRTSGRPRVRILTEPVNANAGASGAGVSGGGIAGGGAGAGSGGGTAGAVSNNGNATGSNSNVSNTSGGISTTVALNSGTSRSGNSRNLRESSIARPNALLGLSGDDRYSSRHERRADRQRSLRISNPYYSRFGTPIGQPFNVVGGNRDRDIPTTSSVNNRNVVFLSTIEDELRMVENLRIGSSADNISMIDNVDADGKASTAANDRKNDESEQRQFLLHKFLKSSERTGSYPIFLANRAEFVCQLLMSAMSDDELRLPDKLVDEGSTITETNQLELGIYSTASLALVTESGRVLDIAIETIESEVPLIILQQDIDNNIDSISELETTTDDEERDIA